MDRPSKRQRLIDDSEGEESDSASIVSDAAALRINADYALRFEHNKKREELHRLQEKYGDLQGSRLNVVQGKEGLEASNSDSEDEDEDDEGVLATEDLDQEIFDTLNAIRNKDPRVYDQTVKFYRPIEQDTNEEGVVLQKEKKPLHLRDYHRANLLSGDNETSAEKLPLRTPQEQDDAEKAELLKQLHDAAEGQDSSDSDSDRDGLLKRKPQQKTAASKMGILLPEPELADKDPEQFLQSFMQSRAWVPNEASKWQPFESDDESEDARADEFEQAYNMRFEDPAKANEKLISHSRETAAKFSVRREERTGRQKKRDDEQARKETEKTEREAEKNRLRRLKIEEAQEKLDKFKEAAGLRGKDVSIDEWAGFLDSGWDDEKWEQEMAKRFGEEYYKADELAEDDGDDDDIVHKRTDAQEEHKTKSKKKHLKKPRWNDDIDINDIVPDFDEQEEHNKVQLAELSDFEHEAENEDDRQPRQQQSPSSPQPDGETNGKIEGKIREQTRTEQKRQARKERRRLEELVDQSLALDELPTSSKKKQAVRGFRYRDTSPSNFGLSARDILMADDSQLNQFIGLKKLAAFREEDRKQRDKKKLGKKQRLRQWRKDTFGNEDGPNTSLQDYIASLETGDSEAQAINHRHRGQKRTNEAAEFGVDIVEGKKLRKKKKSRSRKEKKATTTES